MANITTRLAKGSILTSNEIDSNFSSLNTELQTKLTTDSNISVKHIAITGNIVPTANSQFSLGSADNQWKEIFVSSNTIYLGGVPIGVNETQQLTANGVPVGLVQSVNGQIGNVELTTDSLGEGALYFTDERAVAAITGNTAWKATDWDTAFSWGDHTEAGYALATDVASDISTATANAANWDTAFSWGNHANAGYALDSSLSTVAKTGSYTDLINLPTLGTAASKDVAVSGDALSTQVVLGSDSRLTDARTPLAHTHAISDVTGLQDALDGKQASLGFTPENVANKNVANGYVGLDETGKVAAEHLPSYVDDVLEFADFESLPETGSTGIIYVTLDTNKIYRWSGTAYVEISPTAGTADAATKLATARTISLTGDATGSVLFDGTTDAEITVTVADDSHDHSISTVTGLQDALDAKVDVVAGKQLSTEDYTTDEKQKLANVAENATANLGTVTSVGVEVPTGFAVTGSPVTESGDIAIAFAEGYALPTTAKQADWDAAFGWGDHSLVGYALASNVATDISTAVSDATANAANWDAAYSWGNHANVGYALAADVTVITGNVANWDAAYSWGDHSLAGYAIATTVATDISTAVSNATANVANWDAAYSWGDHALAGYAIDSTLAAVAKSGSYNDLLNLPDLSVLAEIKQFADLAAFPVTGEDNKVYIANDTGYMYRWNGTSYTQLTDQTAIWGQISGNIADQADVATAISTAISTKQDTLVSGDNIKTVNGQTVLGSGNLGFNVVNVVETQNVTSGATSITLANVVLAGTRPLIFVDTYAGSYYINDYTVTSNTSISFGSAITDSGKITVVESQMAYLDAETVSAFNAHEMQSDPHPQYAKSDTLYDAQLLYWQG